MLLGHDKQHAALFLAVPPLAVKDGYSALHFQTHLVCDEVALVRNDDELYALPCSVYDKVQEVHGHNHGQIADNQRLHIMEKQIAATDDKDVPTKVSLELLLTDETKPPMERLITKSEKKSLYDALDIGLIWLQRALKNK